MCAIDAGLTRVFAAAADVQAAFHRPGRTFWPISSRLSRLLQDAQTFGLLSGQFRNKITREPKTVKGFSLQQAQHGGDSSTDCCACQSVRGFSKFISVAFSSRLSNVGSQTLDNSIKLRVITNRRTNNTLAQGDVSLLPDYE